MKNTLSVLVGTIGTAIQLVVVALIATTAAQAAGRVHVAYVTNLGSGYGSNDVARISVINVDSDEYIGTVVDSRGGHPRGIAITPDGAYAYVTYSDTDNVSVIDTAANAVVNTVAVGVGPGGIAITPDGARAYVTISGGNVHEIGVPGVAVIDTATHTVTATIAVGTSPGAVAITPDGAHAYVTNGDSNNVSVIDTATNTVTATIAVGTFPEAVAITPDGSRAYVPSGGQNGRVYVIDTATNTVTTTIAVGAFPEGVAITPDGTYAYVTNFIPASISVIDVATNLVIRTVALSSSSYPVGIAFAPDGTRAYVATSDGNLNALTVIDIATNTVTKTLGGITQPQAIAITPIAIEVAPRISSVVADPNPAAPNSSVELTAVVDDSMTGGGSVSSAEYSVDSGPYSPMLSGDGSFDNDRESVSATLPGISPVGIHKVCVRGSDDAGTTSDPTGDPQNACSFVVVFDPSTPVGRDVPVYLLAQVPNGETSLAVEVTFGSVATAGSTTVQVTSSPPVGVPEAPPQFMLGSMPLYYDVSSTATFSGAVTLCFHWVEGQFGNENSIGLHHFVDGHWQTITTFRDVGTNQICGSVSSLSPFAIFERQLAIDGFLQPVENQPTVNLVKAGAAVPVKFSVGIDAGLGIIADGYPSSRSINCDTSAPLDALTEILTAGSSGLTYDASTNEYTYVWKTDKAWTQSCRRLTVRLRGGATKSSDFKFRK